MDTLRIQAGLDRVTLVVSSIVVTALAGQATTATAVGQTPLHAYVGSAPNDFLGRSVSTAGDVDGDGRADFVYSAVGDDSAGSNRGRVWVRSSVDGSILHVMDGTVDDGEFGYSVAGNLDLDADGTPDVVVSEPGAGSTGTARAFSGANGSILYEAHGTASTDPLRYVTDAGDANSDGHDDFIVWPSDVGRARIHSGVDASVLGEIDAGWSPVGIGDLDGNGLPEIAAVVGAFVRIYTYSGAGFSTYADVFSVSTGVVPAGDIDGDGVRDFLTTDFFAHAGSGVHAGVALAHSGATLQVIGHWIGNTTGPNHSQLGPLPSLGDLDGDGHADVAIKASDNGGYIRVYSGATNEVIWEVLGIRAGAIVDDLDGDGLSDVIAVDHRHTPLNGPMWAGQLIAYSGRNPVGASYCGPGVVNSGGLSGRIFASGSTTVQENDLLLIARDLPQQVFGFFLGSRTQGNVPQPGGSQGVLCLSGSIGRFVGPGQIGNAGALGSFTLQVDLTQVATPTALVPVAAGEVWNFQCWYRDSLAGFPTSNFTDAVTIVFL